MWNISSAKLYCEVFLTEAIFRKQLRWPPGYWKQPLYHPTLQKKQATTKTIHLRLRQIIQEKSVSKYPSQLFLWKSKTFPMSLLLLQFFNQAPIDAAWRKMQNQDQQGKVVLVNISTNFCLSLFSPKILTLKCNFV